MERIARMHEARGEAVWAFNGRPNEWLSCARARAARDWRERFPGASTRLFYNGYGVEWGIDDRADTRQFIYLHSDYPNLGAWLARTLRHIDGFIVVNPALVAKIRRDIPYLPESRLHVLPVPVEVPGDVFAAREQPRAQRVIGYAGRVDFRQKRLDRLPAFLAAMDESGLDYRFEILGDGDARRALEVRFAGNPRVVFYGHLEGEAYWRVLRGWKYLFFASDYEGLPLALIEGVGAGLVPLYPRMHDEDWLSPLGEDLYYPFGEARKAVDIIARVEREWSAERWRAFYAQGAQQLRKHTADAYLGAFDALMARVPQLPARRQRYPSPYRGWTPLWLYHRFQSYLRFGSLFAPRFSLPKKP